jgi:copper chaperone CopZ
MKSSIIVFSSLLLLSACSSETETVLLKTEKGVSKEKSKTPVVANRKATIEIEGMTCEMGCGGSIRKELKATGGVERVQYDFVEGRDVNTATISFDKDKVTLDEMIKIITTMNENQFTVGKTSSTDIETPTTSNEAPTKKDNTEKVSMSETSFQIPNLIDILSNLI